MTVQSLPEPAVSVSVRSPVLPALGQSRHCLIQYRTLDKRGKKIFYRLSVESFGQSCRMKIGEIIKDKAHNNKNPINIKLA